MKQLLIALCTCTLLLHTTQAQEAAAEAAEAVVLSTIPKPNQRIVRVENSKIEQDIMIPQAQEPMQQTQSTEATYEIVVRDQDENGNTPVQVTIQRMIIRVNSMGMTMEFDSDDPNMDGPLAEAGAVVGHAIQCSVNEDGSVEITNAEDLADNFEIDMLKPMIESMFKHAFGSSEPKNVGDNWPMQHASSVPGFGEISVEGEQEFERWEEVDGRNLAVLKGNAELNMNADPEPGQPAINMTSGKMAGRCWIDPESQIAYKTQVVMKMNLNIEMAPGMAAKTKVQATTSYTTKSIETIEPEE